MELTLFVLVVEGVKRPLLLPPGDVQSSDRHNDATEKLHQPSEEVPRRLKLIPTETANRLGMDMEEINKLRHAKAYISQLRCDNEQLREKIAAVEAQLDVRPNTVLHQDPSLPSYDFLECEGLIVRLLVLSGFSKSQAPNPKNRL
ncbi:hypothetical protein Q1695_006159 [Nippostrongylus brasiliensis]|nr:hypothetical protein Q1695_006159 [Nippostrongylus brasiliensis]